jgi:ABC-2 type transport system ATP-binding protein
MNVPVLECKSITKSYVKGMPVLRDLSMSIPSGRIVGLLGPNGCGKSTFLKIVTGLLTVDSGEIFIMGEPRTEKSNSYVAYLSERTYLDNNKTVDEIIVFFEEFFPDFDKVRAYEMLTSLEIDTKAKLKTLSKGTKEKVQLVMVMARRAKLYLLDEPIAGVDPAARDFILRTIISNYDPEATIIITTHLIYDIEPVLDEFVFMAKGGQVVLGGVCDEVRAREGKSLDELFKEVFKC